MLDPILTEKYFAHVETVYRIQNPYHNSTHAADVTQTAGVILQAVKSYMADAGRPLDKLEIFSVIFAAAVHDLGHPGVNNDFLIRTRERMALMYKGKSVNENMHVDLAFQIALDNPEINIFSNFSDEQYKQVSRGTAATAAINSGLQGIDQWPIEVSWCMPAHKLMPALMATPTVYHTHNNNKHLRCGNRKGLLGRNDQTHHRMDPNTMASRPPTKQY